MNSGTKTVIHWFQQDLRLSDNPSLSIATKRGIVLALYIFDEHSCGNKTIGAASRCWLHHSLQDLNARLDNKLVVMAGDPLSILLKLAKKYRIGEIHWNRGYEPWQLKRDKILKSNLENRGIIVSTHKSSLLWEPWEVQKKNGGNYKVFTPFYRKGCLELTVPRLPIPTPKKINLLNESTLSKPIDALNLLLNTPWEKKIISHWKVGEIAAKKQLKRFIQKGLGNYQESRNFPAQNGVSRLSPHLHWGEISPNQIWHAIKKLPQNKNTDCFLSELGWREFSYNLLYYYPALPYNNLQKKFDRFPWHKNKKQLEAWKKGETGYPIVDAGMRELWQTGYLHNRLRMIVGSFLVKNLLLPWQEGEKWFWDCLVDADLASNSTGWQWIAGCGVDAAPFFRIFNPVTQGKKFDPMGTYTKKYVPELSNLPDQYLFSPWTAPENILQDAGLKLGKEYPKPIVNLTISRARALEAFKKIKNGQHPNAS